MVLKRHLLKFGLLSCFLVGLFASHVQAAGFRAGPIGSYSRNMIPVRYWDNWITSWGGGLALQADLALLSFEIDALFMRRKSRYSSTIGGMGLESILTLNQVEIPVLGYLRLPTFLGDFRLGGGVSNSFGQGKVQVDSKVYAGGREIASSSTDMSYAQLNLDERGMDAVAAVGADYSFLGKKLKLDFRYQFAVEDRNTSASGEAFKPRSFNFMLGILL